jgi:nucleoside-diphosphate-sugar epimerase
MANYLVTGGAGFIGSNIVRELLRRGESVRVLDNFSTGKRENLAGVEDRIDLIEGDIRDFDVVRRATADMDYVLHHAALPSVPRSVDKPLESLQAGIMGTAQVLLASRDAKVRRVVYAASSSAYGDQEGKYKIETMLPKPLSPYACGKLAGEHLCSVFHVCYGLQTISLRYFNVFGPAQDPNSQYGAAIPLFVTAVLEGHQPVFYGDGYQTRDFTYVDNNVEAVLLATTSDKGGGEVLNIACGASYSLHDLLAAINAAVGTNIQPRYEPPRVGDVRHSMADISLARDVLGYRVVTTFEEGIRRTVAWFKEKMREQRASTPKAER